MTNPHITDFLDLPKTIAIDFDGTLCENKFPEIGEPIEWTVDLVRDLKKRGWKTILWTCRNGEQLDKAVTWCEEHNIPIDQIEGRNA